MIKPPDRNGFATLPLAGRGRLECRDGLRTALGPCQPATQISRKACLIHENPSEMDYLSDYQQLFWEGQFLQECTKIMDVKFFECLGLFWIWFDPGYWCCHLMANLERKLLVLKLASRLRSVLGKKQNMEAVNNHKCQWHNEAPTPIDKMKPNITKHGTTSSHFITHTTPNTQWNLRVIEHHIDTTCNHQNNIKIHKTNSKKYKNTPRICCRGAPGAFILYGWPGRFISPYHLKQPSVGNGLGREREPLRTPSFYIHMYIYI